MKVNGRRVEPGEVEHVLTEHLDVVDSLVLPIGRPAGSLAAFVRTAGPRARAEVVAGVLAHARDRLPRGLVPARVEVVDAWPLTPRGKIDHRALLALLDRAAPRRPEQPMAPEAAPLARILAEELGVACLDEDDNLFGLGAHSLLLTRASYRFRVELGLDVPVGLLFQHQSVGELWPHVRDRRAPAAPKVRQRAWTTAHGGCG